MNKLFVLLCIVGFMNHSCTKNTSEQDQLLQNLAKVTAVDCKGQASNYTFDVTIQSPDLGCEQYADWWEVITPDSILI